MSDICLNELTMRFFTFYKINEPKRGYLIRLPFAVNNLPNDVKIGLFVYRTGQLTSNSFIKLLFFYLTTTSYILEALNEIK
jgi:hypothetical protein